jgi:aryl-alcohol dehydrogenase-like predicted oxidoreductase
MEKRRLPGTEIEITPIVFGAFAIGGWFWGGTEDEQAVSAVHAALDQGVNAIDTAPVYGMGHSEELVARAISGRRHTVVVLTKFGMRWDGAEGVFTFDTKDNTGKPVQVYKFAGKKSVLEECERSLHRLRTDYIDLYQLHWPDKTTPVAETMEALELLLEQGKIRAAGVCNYPADLLEEASSRIIIASNQVAYSMLNRQVELDLVPRCRKSGIGILAHTVLQKGLLAGKIHPGHQFNAGDHRPSNPYFKEANLARLYPLLHALEEIAAARETSLAQLAVNWTINRPGITAALVGARNPEQALENAKAAGFRLSEEECRRIEELLGQLQLDL